MVIIMIQTITIIRVIVNYTKFSESEEISVYKYIYEHIYTYKEHSLMVKPEAWSFKFSVRVWMLFLYSKNITKNAKHSLTGKTAILHIVISGSSPDVSIFI